MILLLLINEDGTLNKRDKWYNASYPNLESELFGMHSHNLKCEVRHTQRETEKQTDRYRYTHP